MMVKPSQTEINWCELESEGVCVQLYPSASRGDVCMSLPLSCLVVLYIKIQVRFSDNVTERCLISN